jgi:colanic acid/amylovoran biosynthesis protein
MNILIAGHDTFENRGCQALVYTTTALLSEVFPDARFKVFSWNPKYDGQRFYANGVKAEFVKHPFNKVEYSFRNRLWLYLNNTLKVRTEKILQVPKYFFGALKWADLVVISGGDILADYSVGAVKHYFFPIAVSIALGKPVYVFAQSFSRYKDSRLKRFCKGYLDKVSLITVREQVSLDYLRELGVKAKVALTADPAFLLRPSGREKVEEIVAAEGIRVDGKPLIGFSVSKTATRWGSASHERFVEHVAATIDRVAQQYPEARFIFVPHVTYCENPDKDDRLVGRKVFEKVTCKERVHRIEGDYSCEDLKGVIGLCDLFVGARTHATIASSSQAIPTIALAYSTKAYGIMESVLDSERCVLDIRELTADRLVAMMEDLLADKEQVSAEMTRRVEGLRRQALSNGELAKELF